MAITTKSSISVNPLELLLYDSNCDWVRRSVIGDAIVQAGPRIQQLGKSGYCASQGTVLCSSLAVINPPQTNPDDLRIKPGPAGYATDRFRRLENLVQALQ